MNPQPQLCLAYGSCPLGSTDAHAGSPDLCPRLGSGASSSMVTMLCSALGAPRSHSGLASVVGASWLLTTYDWAYDTIILPGHLIGAMVDQFITNDKARENKEQQRPSGYTRAEISQGEKQENF